MNRKAVRAAKTNLAAPRIVATVPVSGPVGQLTVNAVTNRVYFLQDDTRNAGALLVLDGKSNKIIARTKIGRLPNSIAVNPRINRVYATNFLDGTVSVLNGRTNRIIATVKVAERCDSIAVNTRTNFVYISTISLSSPNAAIAVINGNTNKLQRTIKVTGRPSRIVVDETTNRIYVTNTSTNSVMVIDGSRQSVMTTVKVGRNPVITPVLSPSNLYIANNLSRFCSVMNVKTNKVSSIPLGRLQSEIMLNPATNKVYVSSAQVSGEGKLFVINGSTNRVALKKVLPTFSDMLINPNTNHLFLIQIDDTKIAPLRVHNGTSLLRIASLRVARNSRGFALNPRTNRIYLGGEDTLTVLQD
jgi:YVTN family beta-propeller protein